MLGPLPRLLILIGNAITPGRGFSEGPFASEAELRELVDLAEASSVIESGERQMIHSVFELGDTLVREVMVPRTDVVFIERHKTLRQAMSLALRSGYSRIPVVGENLDDIVGFAYLKDLTKRVFDRHEAETTERVESVMRPVLYVPDSKPIDALLREMQAERKHVGRRRRRVRRHRRPGHHRGRAGGDRRRDHRRVRRRPRRRRAPRRRRDRVSSRYPVDDLEEVCGVAVDDDDVDTVGGLMAKHLGRVPIAGSVVEVHGLRFEAEAPAGRRNRIGTVLVTPARAGRARAPPGRSPTLSTMPADPASDAHRPRGRQARHPRPLHPGPHPGRRGRLRARPGRPHLRRRDGRPADAAADRGAGGGRDGGLQRRAGPRGGRWCSATRPPSTRPTCPSCATSPGPACRCTWPPPTAPWSPPSSPDHATRRVSRTAVICCHLQRR